MSAPGAGGHPDATPREGEMRPRPWQKGGRLHHLFWTFANQGVVSAGTFVVQIVLAWHLPAASYGVFSLILGGLLTLQLCNATLVFHPMSVRIAAAPGGRVAVLLGGSLVLQIVLSLALGTVAAMVIAGLGRADLVLPALAYFLAWQLQEGLRRGLLSRMRHRVALWGDAACYGGQAACLVALGLAGAIGIGTAFLAMAGSALLGATVHALRQALEMPKSSELRRLTADYWTIGGPAALASGLLAQVRLLVIPWALALVAGPAAAAGLQACSNIVNLTNPVLLGLGNIVPQAASRAKAAGAADPWHVVSGYMLAAALPVALYSAVVMFAPGQVLGLFYGAASDYRAHTLALQLLIAVNLVGFFVETVVSYLHGIARVRRATLINMAGAAIAAILAFPAITLFGLAGGCAALLAANLGRLALARAALVHVAPAARRLTLPSRISPNSQEHPG